MTIERRRVVFRGRVQGVGFRMTARRLASAFPIAGHVRNLDDGGVELVAEGDPDQVAAYLAALRGEFGDKIRDMDQAVEPPGGEILSEFSIRY